MKLWILRPINKAHPAWEPWYDKSFGFVVRAESEQAARELVAFGNEEPRKTTYMPSEGSPGDEGKEAWLDIECSSCKLLCNEGNPQVIMMDFHAA